MERDYIPFVCYDCSANQLQSTVKLFIHSFSWFICQRTVRYRITEIVGFLWFNDTIMTSFKSDCWDSGIGLLFLPTIILYFHTILLTFFSSSDLF